MSSELPVLMPESFIRTPFYLYQLKIGEAAWAEPTALLVNTKRECLLNLSAEAVQTELEPPSATVHYNLMRSSVFDDDFMMLHRWTMYVRREGQHEWSVNIIACNHKWTMADFSVEFAPSGEFYVRPSALYYQAATIWATNGQRACSASDESQIGHMLKEEV